MPCSADVLVRGFTEPPGSEFPPRRSRVSGERRQSIPDVACCMLHVPFPLTFAPRPHAPSVSSVKSVAKTQQFVSRSLCSEFVSIRAHLWLILVKIREIRVKPPVFPICVHLRSSVVETLVSRQFVQFASSHHASVRSSVPHPATIPSAKPKNPVKNIESQRITKNHIKKY
jgi:hypothetical protein